MNVYSMKDIGLRTLRTRVLWVVCGVIIILGEDVLGLNGSHVCTVKQKYNVTKRVKYRAPMSVRTYEWCFAMPPRCSRWTTEMKDLTRLETEERTAEVAICCPGYKMRDVTCVPICPHGRTGPGCSEECPENLWGPNCVHECSKCFHGTCSPLTGECGCEHGWKGESCEISMPVTTTSTVKPILTTKPTSTTSTTTTPTTTIMSTTPATTTSTTPATISTTTSTTPATTSTTPTTTGAKDTITTSAATTSTTERLTTTDMLTIVDSTIVTTEVIKPKVTTEYPTTTKNYFETTYPYSTDIAAESYTNNTTVTTTIPTTTAKVTTMKPEFMTKTTHQTIKFKHKEIWIKPAQKGESLIEKVKVHDTHQRAKTTKTDITLPNTTPRTIIVSIIPTSITYPTFKKISLTTAPFELQKTNSMNLVNNRKTSNQNTSTPTSFFTIKLLSTLSMKITSPTSTVNPLLLKKITKARSYASSVTMPLSPTALISHAIINTTNSMLSTNEANTKLYTSNTITTKLTNTRAHSPGAIDVSTATKTMVTTPLPTKKPKAATRTTMLTVGTTAHPSVSNQSITILQNRSIERNQKTSLIKMNVNKNLTQLMTTERVTSIEDELFHILTEPEHITAVVGEKGDDKNSVDLVSVVSIAGGVMMAVITVAVVIVMLERCRRPRYREVRKENDIQMKVVIGNDVPPPYSRSIFHTPLPDPPTLDKCHYQPISTLDRNLKQFMRPVIVEGISPIMIENFRDIFECHYDHLPRRSLQPRRVLTPSSGHDMEPLSTLVADSTIEALRCEAKVDVLDNTTSEPLYAEIPAWRPPSEHAIAVVNLNGEAITEL